MVEKIRTHIAGQKLFYGIFLFLLIIPFFWFSKHLYILGEDDTGLMYYNTWGTLQESLSIWFSADHIGRLEESAGHFFIFNLLILTLKTLTLGLINVQQLIYGLLMSCSFFYIVKILELIHYRKSPLYYIAGLFYVLSPYFVIIEYYYLMPSTFAILLCPAITYYLLKSIHENTLKPLLYAALWSFVLSRVLITPTFINFYVLLFPFTLLYCFFGKKLDNKFGIGKGIVHFLILSVLIAAINSMILVPLFFARSENSSSAIKQTLTDRNNTDYLINMISYIKQEIELNRVIYYLTNVFPEPISRLQGGRNYDFYTQYIQKTYYFMFFIAISSFVGVVIAIRERKRTILPILILFTVSLGLITVNFFDILKDLYYFLMLKTPFFNMNRIPSMKFHIPFIFYYTLLIGSALVYFIEQLSIENRKTFVISFFAIVLINSYFFWSGNVFRQQIPPAYTVRAMNFNSNYLKLTRELPQVIHDDASFFLFPMGYGFGSFISGENPSQFYRAPITGFKSFTGMNMYGTVRILGSVLDPSIYPAAKKFYFKHTTKKLYQIASKLNVKYVVVTRDIEPLRQFAELIPEHTYESNDYLKPLDLSQAVYRNDGYVVYKLNNYDEVSHFTTKRKDTELSFQKIADFMYLIKIKTKHPDQLIMHEGFSQNWNLYPIESSAFHCDNAKNYARSFPNISECSHQNDNIEGNITLLQNRQTKRFDTNHRVYNNFGNVWEIDTKGTDQYFMILFDGQRYYQRGLALSFLVCGIVIIGTIFYGKRRS